MGFKKTAAEMQQRLLAAVDIPIAYVKEQMVFRLAYNRIHFHAIDLTSRQDCRKSAPIVYIEISRKGQGGRCTLYRGAS
jgi:hypothetical protein